MTRNNTTTIFPFSSKPAHTGIPHQYFHYSPWGESLISQTRTPNPTGFTTPYRFNAKELDPESGLYYYGARYYHPLVSVWLAVDPRSGKYPDYSPYVFTLDNPIHFVDPWGDTVKISFRSGINEMTLIYRGGYLYNKNGSSFEGKINGFLRQALNALNDIQSTREGGTTLEELENSHNIFTIKYGEKNEFSTSSIFKASGNLSEIQAVTGNTGTNGSGGTIFWNPNIVEGGFNTAGNRYRPSFVGLAHELFHGRDANSGIYYPIENYTNPITGATYNAEHNGLLKTEWRAVYYENIMRSQLGIPIRTHYGVREISSGLYIPDGPCLLDEKKSTY